MKIKTRNGFFCNTKYIKYLTLYHSSVKTICYNAFYCCTNLKTITFSEGLQTIGDQIVAHCSNLQSVTIPSTVQTIGNYAFYNCGNLQSVTILSKLESIGNNAFKNCGVLYTIEFAGTREDWDAISIGTEAISSDVEIDCLYGWTLVSIDKQATCTETGLATYTNGTITAQKILPIIPHNLDENNKCTMCEQTFPDTELTNIVGSYGFVLSSGKYKSNNKKVKNSEAVAVLDVYVDGTLTVVWTVSSESNCDKFSVLINKVPYADLTGKSGENSGTTSISVSAGDSVRFVYVKDGGVDSGSDVATFTYSFVKS